MRAMIEASEGNQVLYVCSSQQAARCTFDKAFRLVAVFMTPEHTGNRFSIRIGTRSISFVIDKNNDLINRIKSNPQCSVVWDN